MIFNKMSVEYNTNNELNNGNHFNNENHTKYYDRRSDFKQNRSQDSNTDETTVVYRRNKNQSSSFSGDADEEQQQRSVVFERIVPSAVKKMWIKAEASGAAYNIDQEHLEHQEKIMASPFDSPEKSLSFQYGDIFLSHDVAKEEEETKENSRKDRSDSVSKSSELPQAKGKWGVSLKHVKESDKLPFGFPKLKRVTSGNKQSRPRSSLIDDNFSLTNNLSSRHRSRSVDTLDQIDGESDFSEDYPSELSVQQRRKNFFENNSLKKSGTKPPEFGYLNAKRLSKTDVGHTDLRSGMSKSKIFYQPHHVNSVDLDSSFSSNNFPIKVSDTSSDNCKSKPRNLQELLQHDVASLEVDVRDKATKNISDKNNNIQYESAIILDTTELKNKSRENRKNSHDVSVEKTIKIGDTNISNEEKINSLNTKSTNKSDVKPKIVKQVHVSSAAENSQEETRSPKREYVFSVGKSESKPRKSDVARTEDSVKQEQKQQRLERKQQKLLLQEQQKQEQLSKQEHEKQQKEEKQHQERKQQQILQEEEQQLLKQKEEEQQQQILQEQQEKAKQREDRRKQKQQQEKEQKKEEQRQIHREQERQHEQENKQKEEEKQQILLEQERQQKLLKQQQEQEKQKKEEKQRQEQKQQQIIQERERQQKLLKQQQEQEKQKKEEKQYQERKQQRILQEQEQQRHLLKQKEEQEKQQLQQLQIQKQQQQPNQEQGKPKIRYNKLGQAILTIDSQSENIDGKSETQNTSIVNKNNITNKEKHGSSPNKENDVPKEVDKPAAPPVQNGSSNSRRVGKLIIMTGEQRDQQLKEREANKNAPAGAPRSITMTKEVVNKNAPSPNGISLTFMSNEVADDDPNAPPPVVPTVVYNAPVAKVKSIMAVKNKKQKKKHVHFKTEKMAMVYSYPSESSYLDETDTSGKFVYTTTAVQGERERMLLSDGKPRENITPLEQVNLVTEGDHFNTHSEQEGGSAMLF